MQVMDVMQVFGYWWIYHPKLPTVISHMNKSLYTAGILTSGLLMALAAEMDLITILPAGLAFKYPKDTLQL